MFGVVEPINDDSRDNGKEHAKANGKECQAILPGIESIHSRKSERIGGKEGEEDGERERRVQTEEQHDWFREQHVQWSQESHRQKHLHERQSFHCCLRRRWDVQAFCSSGQDDLFVGLGHAQDWDCDS